MTPIYDIHDEQEHFTRAEILSRGILVPEVIDNKVPTIGSVHDLYIENMFKTIETNTAGTINTSQTLEIGAFNHNPFYGYIPQAIGIFLAKLFSLDAIYMIIFGRIFNSLLYAALISFAIRKTPVLKIPLFAMACIPLTLHQSFSMSIDAMINGLGILSIAYFLYMYKTPNIDKKEIIIFSLICLACGLCKLPYISLILLILLVPKNNFKNNNYYYGFLTIIILGLIAVLWYKFFASASYLSCWRGDYVIRQNVSAASQLEFVKTNFDSFLIMLLNLPNYLYDTMIGLFQFSHDSNIYGNNFINMLLILFIGSVSLFYPLDEKFNLKTRIGLFIISLIIFIGTYLIQFFTWTPVGQTLIVGTQARYFLPLFCLAPIIFNLNKNEPDIDLNNYILSFTMCFISLSVLLITFRFY